MDLRNGGRGVDVTFGGGGIRLGTGGENGFAASFKLLVTVEFRDPRCFWAAFPAQRLPFGMTYFKKPAGRASDGRAAIDFFAQGLGLPFLSPYLQSIGSNYSHGANFATPLLFLNSFSKPMISHINVFHTGIECKILAQIKSTLTINEDLIIVLLICLQVYITKFHNLRVAGIAHLHIAKVTCFIHRENVSIGGYLPPRNVFSQSLYTIDIGQNDFTSNAGTLGIEGIKQYVPQVASQIASTIKELYDIGGRTFLVANLAPIGCFPAFLTELPHDASDLDIYGCMISYNDAVVYYNNLLKERLGQIRDQLLDASVIYVDTHSIKLELFQHPKDHGFVFGNKACCGAGGGAYNFNPQVFCGNTKIINGINVTATACTDPGEYVSWDGIHATEAANKIIAQAVLNGSLFDPPFPLSEVCHLHSVH
ncbi:GDSL esterase/lipase At4g01130-like [Asparagus officinalis]|uniref:GDSL esterase/lipase At4g01130-like n=1 Tax=Asparagus officinalis TaxID=4686 RepID=UPI00098E76B9|nr:GDSL esterase/lipase At4g01130-like [Asparagus officinalis]